jgi:hypothetical protein
MDGQGLRLPSFDFIGMTPSQLDTTRLPSQFNAVLPSRQEFATAPMPPMLGAGRFDKTSERLRVATRLQGFNPKDNDIWKVIIDQFGTGIKQQELLSIATVLASHAHVRLDRDAKRRKAVLVKWFAENWDAISPYLSFVVLEATPN